MRCELKSMGLICTIAASLLALPGQAQTGIAGHADEKFRSISNRPAYPVVLRLSPEALNSFVPGKVDHRQAVDSLVLETRNVGHSHTKGKVSVDLITSDDNDAVFAVVFQGHTHTRTVGTNGPALIDSHADTLFHCSRRIRFDPEVGFVSAPSVLNARTILVYDRFRSSHDGMGSRIVRRVAEKRATESLDEATRVAAQNHKTEILQAFDSRLDAKLVSLNTKPSLARYGGLLFGNSSRLQLALASSKDSLQIGFGPPGNTGHLPGLPPLTANGPQLEIWIHASVLEDRTGTVIPLAELSAHRLFSRRSVWPIWNAVTTARYGANLVPSPVPGLGWFRIGLGSSSRGEPQLARSQSRDDPTTAMKLLELAGSEFFAAALEGSTSTKPASVASAR